MSTKFGVFLFVGT